MDNEHIRLKLLITYQEQNPFIQNKEIVVVAATWPLISKQNSKEFKFATQ
jgi:hypothetical protein